MKQIILDQGLPLAAAELLRQCDWDAVHVSEQGLSRASDRDILHQALKQGRTVVTLDADFHALLAVSGATAPSVVRLRIEGLKSRELADLLIQVWDRVGNALQQGALVTVTATNIRIKLLPVT